MLKDVFHKYSFRHVKRECSQLAHFLARMVVLFVDLDIWVEDLLSKLDVVFQTDLIHL